MIDDFRGRMRQRRFGENRFGVEQFSSFAY